MLKVNRDGRVDDDGHVWNLTEDDASCIQDMFDIYSDHLQPEETINLHEERTLEELMEDDQINDNRSAPSFAQMP